MQSRALREGRRPAGGEDAGEPAGRRRYHSGARKLQDAAAVDVCHGVSPEFIDSSFRAALAASALQT
jgi:hypothetical protein